MMKNSIKSVLEVGSPLGYVPVDGNERRMRFSAGVGPEFIKNRLGEYINEQWHKDPIFRYETKHSVKKKMHELCPNIESFALEYKDGVETSCNSISGMYNISFVTSLYGMKTIYKDDDWAEVENKDFKMSDFEGMEDIKVENSEIYADLMHQMDIMEKEYGAIKGHLNLQGVLNIAFKLRREEIFMDMYDEEEIARHLFANIGNAIIESAKLIQARQRKSGYDVDMCAPQNCVINMISPNMYEDMLFDIDKKIMSSFKNSGIHTCNWNVTPYLDVLSSVKDLGYIDMGGMSDTKRVQETFPNTRKSVLLSPLFLNDKWENQKAVIDRIVSDMNPVDFTMGGLDSSLNIENLNRLNDYVLGHELNK